jgi:hypothetical protein
MFSISSVEIRGEKEDDKEGEGEKEEKGGIAWPTKY